MLSVVALNYKNPALLRLFLASLFRTLPRNYDYEVIVVDSATSYETRSVVQEEFRDVFPAITLVPVKENTGYTRGVNLGVAAAKGDYVFVCNPDIIPLPGSIERMVAYLDGHPKVGLLGPKLLNFNGTRQDSCFRFYTLATILARRIGFLPFASRVVHRFTMHDQALDHPTDVDWLMGSAVMMPRAALERVGLMDERFFHYFSDVDHARRFWENGYQVVYFPDAALYHYHQRESKRWYWFIDALFNQAARWHIIDGSRYLMKYGLFNTTRTHVTP